MTHLDLPPISTDDELILALDPGPQQTGYVYCDAMTLRPIRFDKLPNQHVFELVRHVADLTMDRPDGNVTLLIEMPEGIGATVGSETLKTAYWVGKYEQAWRDRTIDAVHLVTRKAVKLQLTGRTNTKDKDVQFALRLRFNEPPAPKRPVGALKGIAKDMWAALGVAVAWKEIETHAPRGIRWIK